MNQTRRKLRRRKTLRGGLPIIGIVLGSVLAVGIGALMYKTNGRMHNPNSDGEK